MLEVRLAAAGEWALPRDAAFVLSNKLDEFLALSPAALEAHRANRSPHSETLRTRQGIAIVDVIGPLFKRPNLFSIIMGASTYAGIRHDLQIAIDDPAIKGILLNVDSPGGMVNGCDEVATAIYEARGKKPITAFAGGQACSAAYWIASAADGIILSPATEVGSIGVVASVLDKRAADKSRGIRTVEFVSSKAPDKSPDPETAPGRKVIQRRVDALAGVFSAAVARHRGVTVETVNTRFGAGGVELGANAVHHGMADQVGSFEDALAQLRSGRTIGRTKPAPQPTGEKSMPSTTGQYTPADIDRAIANAVANQANRSNAVLGSPEAKNNPGLAKHFLEKTDLSAEQVLGALRAAKSDASQNSAEEFDWNEAFGKPSSSPTTKTEPSEFSWDAIMDQQKADRRGR